MILFAVYTSTEIRFTRASSDFSLIATNFMILTISSTSAIFSTVSHHNTLKKYTCSFFLPQEIISLLIVDERYDKCRDYHRGIQNIFHERIKFNQVLQLSCKKLGC